MMKRLQQIIGRINWRLVIVCAVCVAFLLLSGCGKSPKLPPRNDSYSDCWPCAVYEAAFKAIGTSLEDLISITCNAAMKLMGIGLLFWILFHVMTVIVLQQPNVRKFVLPMAAIFFKAIIISTLIADGDTYLTLIGDRLVQPVLVFFGELSKIMLDSNEVVKNATQAADVSELMPSDSKLFGSAQGIFLDVIYRIYIALHMGIDLGFAIWRTSGLVALIMGFFVMSIFWVLLLIIPLSLVDTLIRMGAVMILSPFCLVGWLFPPTKHLLRKVWDIFFGTGVMLFFLCTYLAISMYIIIKFADTSYPGILGSATQKTNPNLAEDVATLSTSTLGFFVLILSINKLARHVPRIANAFGAQSVASSWGSALRQFKKLAFATGKAAMAVLLASPTLAKGAIEDTAKAAKSAAESMK